MPYYQYTVMERIQKAWAYLSIRLSTRYKTYKVERWCGICQRCLGEDVLSETPYDDIEWLDGKLITLGYDGCESD